MGSSRGQTKQHRQPSLEFAGQLYHNWRELADAVSLDEEHGASRATSKVLLPRNATAVEVRLTAPTRPPRVLMDPMKTCQPVCVWEMQKAHDRSRQVPLRNTALFKGDAGEMAQGIKCWLPELHESGSPAPTEKPAAQG